MSLMTTLRGVTEVVSDREPLPDHDVRCPMMSLPLAFGTTIETIPADVPYLHADPAAYRHGGIGSPMCEGAASALCGIPAPASAMPNWWHWSSANPCHLRRWPRLVRSGGVSSCQSRSDRPRRKRHRRPPG